MNELDTRQEFIDHIAAYTGASRYHIEEAISSFEKETGQKVMIHKPNESSKLARIREYCERVDAKPMFIRNILSILNEE